MASLYQRPGSAFWWIKFRNPIVGKIKRQSTGFRIGNGPDTRRARELESKKTLAERQGSAAGDDGQWGLWVPQFLARRYRNSPGSLLRYQVAWRTIRMFLEERELELPRQIARKHCTMDYFEWRQKPDKPNGKYAASHNTALLEMKFFGGVILQEAVDLGYIDANPGLKLRLSRDPEKKPCELFGEDLAELEAAIEKEPQPKRTVFLRSYLVARYHGVRLNETRVNPVSDVALWEENGAACGRVTFHQKGRLGKGKRSREKPLHPKLIPLFREMQAKGRTELFDCPKSFAKEWHNLFKRIGLKRRLPRACFHSLRVTVENILRRAGVAKELRMAYLSHESRDVNAGYDRIAIEEMRVCHSPLETATPREIGNRFSVVG